jgi:flagellar biosynthesis protein FlhB
MHFGWLIAVGLNLLGLLNMLAFLFPSVRERYMAFMQTVSQSAAPTMPNAAQASAQIFQQQLMANMMFPIFTVCSLFILFILVLLWRARWWYKSSE